MQIIKTKTLTPEQDEELNGLWNEECPVTLTGRYRLLLEDVENYQHHLLFDDGGDIAGWAVEIERDSEVRFSIIVPSTCHGKGYGRMLLDSLKESLDEFYGWVIDHNRDVKANGEPYSTPLPFYLKNGFQLLTGQRIESELISAVKIKWRKSDAAPQSAPARQWPHELISFQPVTECNLPLLANIINHYIEHTTVSFHTEKLQPDDMREKVFFGNPAFQAFTIRHSEEVIGYCAVSLWKKQQAYRHTAEVNIYLSPDYTGAGIGGIAIKHLEAHAQTAGIRNLIAGLCSENLPSKRLFEKAGFVQCAQFKGVGEKFGRTLDTIYLQKILSHKS